MSSTAILIPARYASTRFPGKPLTMLGDKTMIERVVLKCLDTGLDTFVLTDNRTIAYAAKQAGAQSFIDSHDYNNGTERCSGALRSYLLDGYDKFINVQGDMPDVTPQIIQKTNQQLNDYEVSTVCTLMPEKEQNNPNTVKLIRGNGKCLWFGRGITGYGDWHLGVYGYRRETLQSYLNLIHYREEEIEKLEQLRWLKNGVQIGVIAVEWNGVEINTPEDAEKWNESR